MDKATQQVEVRNMSVTVYSKLGRLKRKDLRLTSGGLAGARERIATTNCKKSAEAIVPVSQFKRGRTEQFVVPTTTENWDNGRQNVLMRRVRAYLGGLLKKVNLLSTGKEERQNGTVGENP